MNAQKALLEATSGLSEEAAVIDFSVCTLDARGAVAADRPSICQPSASSGIENELDKCLNMCGARYMVPKPAKWNKH